ncbi:MAG: GTPase HflX [Bdellovibrionales bacterium]|nr:GTPase HflX [Bdellovibrionales bacterium]
MTTSTQAKPLNAVLVSIQLPTVSDTENQASLAELARLVTTMGCKVVHQITQKKDSDRSANVLGDGKLQELAKWTGGPGVVGPTFVRKKHKAALRFERTSDDDPQDNADDEDTDEEEAASEDGNRAKANLVIVDTELSPSQLRNLESATGVPALDRTGVIIEIFSRHAKTRAAKLQVEIARLAYLAPRIRETGKHDRQQGGGGKGSGETSIELDRRKIRDRIKELKEELAEIADEQDSRRSRREEITVALVGYTNAGKSSLMRALTGSEVLVADKLFATLDTTIRGIYPETQPKILISDTVGFIKKLPHDLVASFKSTLDEALHASLLLFVVDSSDPTFRSQLEVTKAVLAEVGAGEVPSRLVLNKIDRLSPEELIQLKVEFPEAIFLSAKNPEDVMALHQTLVRHFESPMVDEDVFIPYNVQGVIGEIRAQMRVLNEVYTEGGVTLTVRAHRENLQRLRIKYSLE